jgi:CheY-like chemotaxis protein
MAAILLIDDMKGVRRTVASLLKRAGHTITEADDGGAGIELLRSGRFDLVITDMLMPKHDGMEVPLFLEQMHNRPRVIAISGGGSQVSLTRPSRWRAARPTRRCRSRSTTPI